VEKRKDKIMTLSAHETARDDRQSAGARAGNPVLDEPTAAWT